MQQPIQIKTNYTRLLADILTPVSIYLKVRQKYPGSVLLESSDYHGNENSLSFIGFDPVATFEASQTSCTTHWPNGSQTQHNLTQTGHLATHIANFAASFKEDITDAPVTGNGLFGYLSYDAVQHFENIKFDQHKPADFEIPIARYALFTYIVVINHVNNDLYLFEHLTDPNQPSQLHLVEQYIRQTLVETSHFTLNNDETSNITDEEYMQMVSQGKHHCQRGDVFQIVLSRRFSSGFSGDDFMVYRALRRINPSPYLFYFDYGSYHIFGSSPEAQIQIQNGKAAIYPIAGTFKRTGRDQADKELAEQLATDPKENAEHVMLVDLARNDLSRDGNQVTVEVFREVQFYSHVIHLVSKVTGNISPQVTPFSMVANTFPAGTLSGAPKHRAMQLIDKYENRKRGYYGGAIGYLGFNGDFNHAIMIRSFLSYGHRLYYQAGAGVVVKSQEENELQEVKNKLAALRQALITAQKIKP